LKQTKKQQPLLDSGQRDNGLAGKLFSLWSIPLAKHATMDTTMMGDVLYAIRTASVHLKKSLAVSLKGLGAKAK
jgi:hypothetical protein